VTENHNRDHSFDIFDFNLSNI